MSSIIDPRVAIVLFWVAAACCAVGQAAILRALVGTRGASGHATGAPRPRWLVEAVWAILPAIALAAVLALTWQRTRDRGVVTTAPARAAADAARGADR